MMALRSRPKTVCSRTKSLLIPNVATPYASSYMDVPKAEVVDKHTFRVTYKEPFSPALESWAMGIIPKHLLEGKDLNTSSFNRNPVGTGPYKFKEWIAGQKIVLEANPDYFEGRPKIDTFIYRIIPDSTTMFQELLFGGVDFMGLTPLQYLRKSETRRIRENYNKFRYPANGYTYMGYNLRNPLFKEIKVRQALSYAINRQNIIDGIMLGIGQPCTGPFSYVSWAYNPEAKSYPYDPELAKRMLAEEGWKIRSGDGILVKDGRPFRFTILTNQGNNERIRTAEILQQNLKAVGIDVNIRVMEWQAFLEQIDKRSFDAMILGWSMGRDPDLYDIWHSSKTKKGEYNFIGYKNAEIDKLLVEGRRIFDIEKEKKYTTASTKFWQKSSPTLSCTYPMPPDRAQTLQRHRGRTARHHVQLHRLACAEEQDGVVKTIFKTRNTRKMRMIVLHFLSRLFSFDLR